MLGKQFFRALPIIGRCWHFTGLIFLRPILDTDKDVLEHDTQQLVNNYTKNYFFNVCL